MQTQSFQLVALPATPKFIHTLNSWGFAGYVVYLMISMIIAMFLSEKLAESWGYQSLLQGVIFVAIFITPILSIRWAWSKQANKKPLTVLGKIDITPTEVSLEYETEEDVVIPMSQIRRIDVYEKFPSTRNTTLVHAPLPLLPIRLVKITGPMGVLDCYVKAETGEKKEDNSLDLYLKQIKLLSLDLHRKIQMWEPSA
ncbi:MAG: hypothetical protein NWR72_14175 [Bacteroidia bacterium]|nr:hypothetical protein [Bacteroidia bacterium]